MPTLNVNTDEIVRLANKLEKMHRSHFPNAVRGTLNKAAFDMKQKSLLQTTKASFEKKHPYNVYRLSSTVSKAVGWDVKSMVSTVGFSNDRLGGKDKTFAQDLEQQDIGGTLQGSRDYLPLKGARTGPSKSVGMANRLSIIEGENIIDAKRMKGKTPRSRYTAGAIKASEESGYLLGNGTSRRILYRVKGVTRTGRKVKVNKTALYSIRKNHQVTIKKPTHFRMKAVKITGQQMQKFFSQEAQRQIAKAAAK